MYYAAFGILALIIHLIINHEILKKRNADGAGPAYTRYRQFLICITVYYVSDVTWGFLHEARLIALVYADTFIYFLTMALAVFLWTRYVVAFIDRKGARSTSLLYGGAIIFALVVISLVINIFYPVIYAIDPVQGYIALPFRYCIFVILFLLHMVLSVYSMIVSGKVTGKDKVHYATVSVSGAVMAVFIVMQIQYPLLPFFALGLIVSTCLIHVYVEEDEKLETDQRLRQIEKEEEIYSHIADSLAEDYEAIYYIDIESGDYREFSQSALYESMNVPKYIRDFYADTYDNVIRYVHPDDREYALSLYTREAMLGNLEGRKSFSYMYRLMIEGEPRYFRFVTMLADDGKHLVLCEKDINDEITAEKRRTEYQKNHITFGQIAESLASNYDVIYYVDIRTGEYVTYTTRSIYGQLEVEEAGTDFYKDSEKNMQLLIHPRDREKMRELLDRDHMISTFENRKQIEAEYRMIVDDKARYTRLTARRSSDLNHVIIGVENIDEDVRKEKEQLRALNSEKELARRDELTGIKNKTAYLELEQSVQRNIDDGMDYLPFAIAVCDVNDLKKMNDTEGHNAGDELLKSSAKLLCDIFNHSPVFRIGGDEFAIFLRGDDYTSRQDLMLKLRSRVRDNQRSGQGPVIASGMSEYIAGQDSKISEVFERADNIMYADKRSLKENPYG